MPTRTQLAVGFFVLVACNVATTAMLAYVIFARPTFQIEGSITGLVDVDNSYRQFHVTIDPP